MFLSNAKMKVKIAVYLLTAFSLALAGRLFYLGIVKGDYYRAMALGQQMIFEEIKGKRGEIFLNGGKIALAKTEKENLVYVFPHQIPQEKFGKVAENLAEIIGEKKEKILSSLNKGEIFKKNVSQDALGKLKTQEIEGVHLEEGWGRVYPEKTLASHVLGFLNQDGLGQYGVEEFYNNELQGVVGITKKSNSFFNYLETVGGISNDEPLKGADIFLTLERDLQYFSEKLLAKAYQDWKIDSGQIIVSDPFTGRILVMAVFPPFDPNEYAKEKDLSVFMNPVLQALFEPGSIFKPITFAAALEERLITPEMAYEDTGSVNLGGAPIYNYGKRVWGKRTMTGVLENSINTGAVFVEQKLGNDLFLKYTEKMGFFEKTNIDLQGEIYSSNEILRTGRPRDVAVASFGQGINVTPIQIVRAFGAIANGGDLLQPFVVEKIRESNGQIKEYGRRFQRKVLSKSTCETLTSMLISVVENGSARRAKVAGYLIAGKTGTAQVPLKSGGYSETETIHSFVGFFPALEPKFLVFVKLDNPKGISMSGYSAAAVAGELIKYIADVKQIPPNTAAMAE